MADIGLLLKLFKSNPQAFGQLIYNLQRQPPLKNVPNQIKKFMGGPNATVPLPMQRM